MANHARIKLPWNVDLSIMELFAGEAMEAAFGGFYGECPDGGGLSFRQRETGEGGPWGTTDVWSDSGRHVEMRHGCEGLDTVAQAMEFGALGACFGASLAEDEGIGAYLLERPGVLRLGPMRAMGGGLGFQAGAAGDGLHGLIGQLLGGGKGGSSGEGMWMMGARAGAAAEKLLDPVFFNPPVGTPGALDGSGDPMSDRERAAARDVVDWGSRLDWAKAVEEAYPEGRGMGARLAANALLPSAALGGRCPGPALEKAGVPGLERALAVALLWTRGETALAIHGRLCEASADPLASEAKAKELCDKALFLRSRIDQGRRIENHAEESSALYEALALGRASRPARGPKGRRPGL